MKRRTVKWSKRVAETVRVLKSNFRGSQHRKFMPTKVSVRGNDP